MKLLTLIAFTCCLASWPTFSQDRTQDSLSLLYHNLDNDSLEKDLKLVSGKTKVDLLGDLSHRYAWLNSTRGIDYARDGIRLAEQINYTAGLAKCLDSYALCLTVFGDFSTALKFALQALHLYEKLSDQERVAWTYIVLTNVYRDYGDYQRALATALKSVYLYENLKISPRVPYAATASVYVKLGKLDSALYFAQRAYELDKKDNKGIWPYPPMVLASVHTSLGNLELAMAYYRLAIPLAFKVQFEKDIIDIYNGIATLYTRTKKYDSSIAYCNEVITKWKHTSYQKGVLDASNILVKIYENKNERDSIIKYLKMSVTLNDSLYSRNKEREIQNITFNEDVRMQVLNAEQLEEKKQRELNLQYIFIAIGLITFIILFILLSQKTIRSPRTIIFFGTLGLLMVFEFVNLIAHPFLSSLTGHSPLLMLLGMVLIAAILIPVHHRLVNWVSNRLVEKNRKLRLRDAYATISELETTPEKPKSVGKNRTAKVKSDAKKRE